jgi:hypothetical protein
MKTADELMSDQVVANIFAPDTAGPWQPEIATSAIERDGKAWKVRFAVEIPPDITLLPDGDGLAGNYTVYVAVGTMQGALSTVFRQPQIVRILPSEENAFRSEPLSFGGTLTLRPGENIVSVGVVDQLSGDKGFARATVVAR